MPVITPQGILGKVLRTYPHSSLVLEINDPTSGAGVILEKSRLQGILRGDANRAGETVVNNIMADEKIEPGEQIVTSGGDRVYPKGLTVGTVVDARPTGDGTFLRIRVKPAASLDRVEEVLIITNVEDKTPTVDTNAPVRAIDILAQRLPSVPVVKPPDAPASAIAQPGQVGTMTPNPAPPAGPTPKPNDGAGAAGKKAPPSPVDSKTEKPKPPNPQAKDTPR